MEAGLADVTRPSKKSPPSSDKPRRKLCMSSVYGGRRKHSREQSRKNSAPCSKELAKKAGSMKDEWTKVISGDRLVKFTY